jgi:hypothetical protein
MRGGWCKPRTGRSSYRPEPRRWRASSPDRIFSPSTPTLEVHVIPVSGFRPATLPMAALLALSAATAGAAQTPAQVVPSVENPRIHDIARAASPARMERDIRTLVGFGTRHTLSDTVSATRGIGAAHRWIHDEFNRISAECGGCLEVSYVSGIVEGDPETRIRQDLNVVNVIAVQRAGPAPTATRSSRATSTRACRT